MNEFLPRWLVRDPEQTLDEIGPSHEPFQRETKWMVLRFWNTISLVGTDRAATNWIGWAEPTPKSNFKSMWRRTRKLRNSKGDRRTNVSKHKLGFSTSLDRLEVRRTQTRRVQRPGGYTIRLTNEREQKRGGTITCVRTC